MVDWPTIVAGVTLAAVSQLSPIQTSLVGTTTEYAVAGGGIALAGLLGVRPHPLVTGVGLVMIPLGRWINLKAQLKFQAGNPINPQNNWPGSTVTYAGWVVTVIGILVGAVHK